MKTRTTWAATAALCSIIAAVSLFTLLAQRHEQAKITQVDRSEAHLLNTDWGRNVLLRESDYIVNCSLTENAVHHLAITPAADAYGAINDVRVSDRGADWVMPGEGAEAAIGLMAAATRLRRLGLPSARYDSVLHSYFDFWLAGHRQCWTEGAADSGGVASRVYYDSHGRRQSRERPTAAVTGIVLCAMWKRYEYMRACGQADAAHAWLHTAWPLAKAGGDFLTRNYDPKTQMVRGNGTTADLWLTDSALSAAGLRCLEQWAMTVRSGDPAAYHTLADSICGGLRQMKDRSTRPEFFRFRDHSHQDSPAYGDSIDQTCFLPYEADVLDPKDPFAKQISDWWTLGDGDIQMTPHTDNPTDWRYYGTHWHHYFESRAENQYLYPGPGLQLAKMEWKHAHAASDPELLARARRRLAWAVQSSYSALWFGASEKTEANVPNGVAEWRDAEQYAHTAEDWDRFVDTSAYLIEVTLMVCFDTDTKYVPETVENRR
jgi:hypothetical protein